MTREHEYLSAMVDGESLGRDEGFSGEGSKKASAEYSDLAKSIVNDPALNAKWRSYHLTRDLLRNDMSSDVGFDISDAVALALNDELTMVAPKRTWRELPVISAVLPIFKQSGQLAMAASVTAMVIFGVQTYNKPEVSDPFMTAPPIIGPQGGLAPVSLQSNSITQQDRMDQLLQQRRQINSLIQDHMRQQRMRSLSPNDTNKSDGANEKDKFDESGNDAQ